MERSLCLRPATPIDRDFLLRLYASTRAEELALTAWNEEQKSAFLEMQFEAQSRAYAAYENATFSIIMAGEEEAGRLYVARWPEEMRIIDLALLPQFRNTGIGTHFLSKLLDEARVENKTVTIHVERFNRALRLYARLGFAVVAERGVYLQLEWRAASAFSSSSPQKVAVEPPD